ncbi:MAG: hypothetical protein QHH10_10990 [Peptococcaceae bacterium]|nr:hypothetical protein [Peptococcaceae bacterium]MDH7525825.1 hypothetical protein [Peptococcaceae bacterium]
MKISFWMISGLFVSILIMDVTTVWATRNKIGVALDMALDAAMVGGLLEYDAKGGKSIIDESKGYALAVGFLKNNLRLNDQLENDLLKNSKFIATIVQDGNKPRGKVLFSTVIKAMTPKLFGMEGIPVVITKTRYHLSNYK